MSKKKTLLETLNKYSWVVAKKTRRGGVSSVVMSPTVAAFLQGMEAAEEEISGKNAVDKKIKEKLDYAEAYFG